MFTLGKFLKCIETAKYNYGITDDCEIYLSCDGVFFIYKDDKEVIIDTVDNIFGICLKGKYLEEPDPEPFIEEDCFEMSNRITIEQNGEI